MTSQVPSPPLVIATSNIQTKLGDKQLTQIKQKILKTNISKKLCSRTQNFTLNISGEEFSQPETAFCTMYISGTTETSLKIVNPILEELATCLLLKLSPYHFKSDLEDVTDMHLTWHQEVELTNGEQTSTKTVYGVHKLFFSETMSDFKCIIHY